MDWIQKAINSKEYKAYKYLVHIGAYNEEIARKATLAINKALMLSNAVDGKFKPIRVNYVREE